MRIIHTDGGNKATYKDFHEICVKLDKSLNDNVPGRKEAGLNSLYNIENIKDVFLLYDGEKVIGSSGIWQHDEKVCELMRVFIDDSYRGRGLVGKLIKKVEGLALALGYQEMMLRTWSSTPYSVRAYEKLGFRRVAASEIKFKDKFPSALALSSLRVYMVKDLI